jgi:hypothetical protein
MKDGKKRKLYFPGHVRNYERIQYQSEAKDEVFLA